jgi:potassium/chloride transporter 4/5/6
VLARTSSSGQPTIATWVTGAIALAAVALGDLNAVGRWVTIFFLTLYVTINLAAGLERLVGDVSFRPTLRIPWFVSLAGSAGAILVMFLINRLACAAAIGLELLLYLHLRRKALRSAWGDVRAGAWNALARFSLLQLRGRVEQARNWRPHILLFTANPASRIGLVRMANWFNQNRGVVTVCQLVEGDLRTKDIDLDQLRHGMEQTLTKEGLVAFGEVSIVPRFEDGLLAIAQASGFGGMQPNTLMFGWPNDRAGVALLLRVMRAAARIEKNIVFARLPRAEGPIFQRRIDVWWRGRQHNGDLMILLAYLLSLNAEWRQARVTVRTIVQTEAEQATMRKMLAELIAEARISAATDVVVRPSDSTVEAVMCKASREADVVFLGLGMPEAGEEEAYATRLLELAPLFRSTIFVRNNGPFRGALL